MKILDAFFKNTQAVQNTAAPLRGTAKAEQAAAAVQGAETESGRVLAELKEQGYVLSSEEADRISEFIDSAEGTESEKLQTVKTALDKGLPLTTRSLQSIRAALFQPALSQELQLSLADAAVEMPLDRVDLLRVFALMAAEEDAGLQLSPEQGLLAQSGLISADATEPTVLASSGAMAAAKDTQIMSWLMQALEQVSELGASFALPEADAEAAVSESRPLRLNEASLRLQKAIFEPGLSGIEAPESENTDEIPVRELPRAGRTEAEPVPPKQMEEAVEQILSGLDRQDASPQEAAAEVLPPEALVQGISLLMKEITPKMAAVKTEFEALRKTLNSALSEVRQALDKPVLSDKPQVVEKLSQAIERLDQAILKSDIPLYTSMKAEKQLLSWSSELQEARSLIGEGKNSEAAVIVDRIAKGVQEIQFQPAKLKVIHRTLQQAVAGNDFTEKGLQQRAQQQVNRILEPVHTPREVLEAFKALGLTHESEVVSALSQSNKKQKDDWQPQENLKEILMKLAAETQEKLTTVTGAEKTLNNLTGQQLLSRPEAKPQGQTLFFSLPMELGSRVEDLKIYVQSRKDKGKVDWENCTFYFAVHTEKYGDVGIRFAAARKSVSIQVKCDNQALRDAVGPMVEDFKQAMWETGYKIAGISYSPLKDTKSETVQAVESVETEPDGKGLNIRV